MKRGFLVITMWSLLFCMGGCGSMQENMNHSAAQEEQKDTPTDLEEKPAPEGAESDKAASEAAMEYLDVSFDYTYDTAYDQVSLMYGHYGSICLNSEGYSALADALDNYNAGKVANRQAYLDNIEQLAADEYKEYGAEDFMGPYVWEGDMSVRRADSKVLSVLEECYDYSGGVHGYSYFNSVNLDAQTGQQIALEEVIKDTSALAEILDTELHEKYPDIVFWSDPLADTLKEYFVENSAMSSLTWTLDYEGVTFYFGHYDIASYVDGLQQVTLTCSEYPELFAEKYFADKPTDYVVKLNDCRYQSDVDLGNDGITDYVSARINYGSDYGMYESYEITVNGNTLTQEEYFFDLETYLVRVGEKNYLYVETVAENDYRSVDVFEITKTSAEYKGGFGGGLEGFTNSTDFKLSKRMDMLSTFAAMANCYVGEAGMPVEKSGVYTIAGEIILTSTVDISAELVDEGGKLTGSTFTFPAGTDFQLIVTDGASYVDVLAEDGQRCRFNVTPDWPQTINGMDAMDCFEMLYYAG